MTEEAIVNAIGNYLETNYPKSFTQNIVKSFPFRRIKGYEWIKRKNAEETTGVVYDPKSEFVSVMTSFYINSLDIPRETIHKFEGILGDLAVKLTEEYDFLYTIERRKSLQNIVPSVVGHFAVDEFYVRKCSTVEKSPEDVLKFIKNGLFDIEPLIEGRNKELESFGIKVFGKEYAE